MSTPVVEIHGTGTQNKGAELMACAIARQLRQTIPGVRLAVGARFGSFAHRARYALFVSNCFGGRCQDRFHQLYLSLAPAPIKQAVGLVEDAEINAVVDASGFAFSDKWGPAPAESLVRLMQRPSRQHQKLILLPQAFGPFRRPDVASACRKLLARADLVYARDPDSLAALRELGVKQEVGVCADFTAGVPGVPPPEGILPERFAAIVPNQRMLDQTSAEDAEHYLRLLQFAVGFFRDAGLPSVVVLHDANEDRQVLPALFARTGKLPVIEHSDPRCLKGVLGKAHVLVGSRYHALVSALSQAVPCIGAGWAHKYQWLFNDYDCDECLLELRRSEEYLAQALARVCDAERRRELIGRLSGRSDWIRRQVEQMWRRVSQMISLAWLWREVRP